MVVPDSVQLPVPPLTATAEMLCGVGVVVSVKVVLPASEPLFVTEITYLTVPPGIVSIGLAVLEKTRLGAVLTQTVVWATWVPFWVTVFVTGNWLGPQPGPGVPGKVVGMFAV
jgi:hypothetical protein